MKYYSLPRLLIVLVLSLWGSLSAHARPPRLAGGDVLSSGPAHLVRPLAVTFSDLNTAPFPALQFGARRLFFDADSDGDLDMLFQNGNVAGVGIAFSFNNGSGVYSPTITATTSGTLASFNSGPLSGVSFGQITTASLFTLDYDNDGDTDLFESANNTTTSGTATGRIIRQQGAPPKLSATVPTDNATNINPASNLTLTFNGSVSKGAGNLYLVRTASNTVLETIPITSAQVSGSGTTWTIDPTSTLADNTAYALRSDKGTFKDADGRIFAGIANLTTFNFTTGVANKAPTDIILTTSSVAENQSAGTVVGSFSTTDADGGQTYTYTLVGGSGADDNTSFQIVGSQLRTNAVFNFEAKSSYSIRVQTTDSGTPALSFQRVFTITVTNINELVVTTSQTNVACNGGTTGGVTVTASGENAPFSYTWRNLTTNTALAQSASTITGLTAGTYSVTVTATSSGFTANTSFTISQPSALSLTSVSTNVSSLGARTGTASVTVSGGTPAYSYDWIPGNPTGDGTSAISSLSAGTYSVQVTDANGCQIIRSVTVGTDSDLTPLLYARPSTLYDNAPFNVVVDVQELNGVVSSGLITVKLSKDAQTSLVFEPGLTSVGGRSVQNGSWSFSSDDSYYIFTTSQAITGGGTLSLGLSGQLTAKATSGMFTLSVSVGGGAESKLVNNSDADKVEYFQP